MEEQILKFLYLNPEKNSDIPLPRYMTPQSSGMDICAAVEKDVIIESGTICMIPTGFAVAVPSGFEAQIRPRSGLAAKHGVSLINSPGTIDADYRGEVMLAVINLGKTAYTVRRGDRVAQMVIQKICQVRLQVVEELEKTDRNTGGFGHSGQR